MDVQLTTRGFLAKVRDHKALRDQVRFYAPLRSSLKYFKGFGTAVFTRAAPSVALWADGSPHAVAANQPRFEWDAEGRPLGIALTTGESLSFAATNQLTDNNTLCWIEDSIFKSTPDQTNIFTSQGVLQFMPGAHYCEIIKWKKPLNQTEKTLVRSLLSDLIIAVAQPPVVGDPPVAPALQFGTVAVAAGVTSITVSHVLGNSAIVFAATPNWPTRLWIVSRNSSSVTVAFAVPAPSGGGALDWGGTVI